MWVGLDESRGTINSPVQLEGTNPQWFQVNNSASELWKNVNFWLLNIFPPAICKPESTVLSVGDLKVVAPKLLTKTVLKNGKNYQVPDCVGYGPNNINSCKFDPACETLKGYVSVSNPAGWGLENSHFLNWMESPFSPVVQKVWAKGTEKLHAGDSIRVFITDRFPIHGSNFKKSVVLSSINWQGSRNVPFCVLCIVVGCLYVIFGTGVAVYSNLHPRKMGDVTYYNFSDPLLEARLRALNGKNTTEMLLSLLRGARTRLERPYQRMLAKLVKRFPQFNRFSKK
jgi:hypothetical protein